MQLDFDRWATRLKAFADFVPIAVLLGASIFITVIVALFPGNPLQAWVAQSDTGVLIGLLTLVTIGGALILMKLRAIETLLKDDALARIMSAAKIVQLRLCGARVQ